MKTFDASLYNIYSDLWDHDRLKFGLMMMMYRNFRDFPFDAILYGGVGLAFLSWTNEVEYFRLSIHRDYEHLFAYALIGLLVMAAKGFRMLTLIDGSILILLAAVMESLKYFVPYRHPKTTDFYADLLGLSASAGILIILHVSAAIIRYGLNTLTRRLFYRIS